MVNYRILIAGKPAVKSLEFEQRSPRNNTEKDIIANLLPKPKRMNKVHKILVFGSKILYSIG